MGFFKGLLTIPEANSRLIYIMWSCVMCVSFLMVLHALLNAPPAQQSSLRELLFIVAGGHLSGSVGRLVTKVGDGMQGDPPKE